MKNTAITDRNHETREKFILKVSGLAKFFGGVRACDNLNFALKKGDLHCIVGPNGAGKSTFFKILMGTIKADKGTIFLNDEEITNMPTYMRARKGLGIKFQNMQVYSELTVFQNFFVPLRRHHKPSEMHDLVHNILLRINLEGFINHRVKNLSHGQQQWLSIGMSIALEPELLLLDEPAAGMGPEETEETAEIIRSLNKEGMSILVIEHDMEFIKNLNTRTTVLHLGALFAEGSYEDIANHAGVRSIYLGKN